MGVKEEFHELFWRVRDMPDTPQRAEALAALRVPFPKAEEAVARVKEILAADVVAPPAAEEPAEDASTARRRRRGRDREERGGSDRSE